MAKQLTINIPYTAVDDAIEKLNIAGIFNLYYEQPFETTIEDNGYGIEVKDDTDIQLHIIVEENNDTTEVSRLVSETLKVSSEEISQVDITLDYTPVQFEDIKLKNGWTICYDENVGDSERKMIYLDPQGAFGTGIHETTQDCLQIILGHELGGFNVLDIGTGSGVLAIAAAVKGASNVTAIDIEPVEREVLHQAKLNDVTNINVHQADVIKSEYSFPERIDWTIINIGADETVKIIEQEQLYRYSKCLLISGVVEWNEEKVSTYLRNVGFEVSERIQTNEWVTALYCKGV
ncbi:50S ribosomal protein L11 methyltransferase [Alkalihalobacterium elongatum]|uniref:50S ribosomal protein L11 methyltransferase n=1 Tax=Alkalihalobacterium elongatum TaxID=2675466 RepID=UPI001C1FA676|nr:50S ribosomal protein L11 methyltransferase [Alkalihalobacterium elongatum]